MSGFDPNFRPIPYVYEMPSASAVQSPSPNIGQRQVAAQLQPLQLMPTNEPVWPEDEVKESESLELLRKRLPALVQEDHLPELGQGVAAKLPDILDIFPIPLIRDGSRFLLAPFGSPELVRQVPPADYYFFSLPVSLSTPADRNVRRMRLEIELFDDAGESRETWVPIVQAMYPDTAYQVRKHDIGAVSVDSSTIESLMPWLPVSLKVALPFQWETVRPQIESSGLMRHDCMWRVSDERITNSFTAGVVVRAAMHHVFQVSVRLHIELRWRKFGAIRRGYMWNDADRRKFQLDPSHSMLVGRERVDEVSMSGQVLGLSKSSYNDWPFDINPAVYGDSISRITSYLDINDYKVVAGTTSPWSKEPSPWKIPSPHVSLESLRQERDRLQAEIESLRGGIDPSQPSSEP